MRTARRLSGEPPRQGSRRSAIGSMALACVAVALLAGPAAAHRSDPEPAWDRDTHATGSLVDVQVLVDGKRVPLYQSWRLGDRRYFAAERGHNYALRLRNRTGRRIAVLIAVDGLNVVNGARSSLARTEPMYVLDPWEQATIRGWRTSLAQVRQFVFVDEERSYANRTDQANGDMGWIRVLAFEEAGRVSWYGRPWDMRRGAADGGPAADARKAAPRAPAEARAPSSEAPMEQELGGDAADRDLATSEAPQARPEPSPGTGWGKRRHDPVREVEFEPAYAALDHLVLRYEYASGLAALGIFPDDDRLWERERGEFGFAAPPRW